MLVVFSSIIACEPEPIDENRLDFDFVSSTPQAAEGVLLNAYTGLVNQYSFSEAATDDAVNNNSNKKTNGFKRLALGELNAQYNPASRWNNFERVFWANKFLEIVNAGQIVWKRDEVVNKLFNDRLKGEALALRGLHHFYALQAHAGKSTSGKLLGIPYFTEFISSDGNFNTPRLSFEASLEAIIKDFDDAIELLPTDYGSKDEEDERYDDIDPDLYKIANGTQYNLRISGRIVKALKARLALFAASPAFLDGQGYYELAAEYAGDILESIGGTSGLSPSGLEFYTSDNNIINDDEMLWRGSLGGNSSAYEERMFPPSLNGKGEINPTQNFVDAFPMSDGTPIDVSTSNYNPQAPYENRDPRLEKLVVVNGKTSFGALINTGVGGKIDRLDSIAELSTTTGYYLKKLLRPDVVLASDGAKTGKGHASVYFRYTELFLIFAEAANELGGPDHTVNGMTPLQVIQAIRERAGITQPDAYLDNISTTDDKEAMRALIRNERRIELSFEGHRFWDLRRWGVNLNETAKGYLFDGNSYQDFSVENRNFPAHATYMPIPNSEILKFPALEQNSDW